MTNKYELAILVKHAYIDTDDGLKSLEDVWSKDFCILEEACKKAQLYDELNEKVQNNYKGYFTPNQEPIVLDEKLLDQYYRMEKLLEKYELEEMEKK